MGAWSDTFAENAIESGFVAIIDAERGEGSELNGVNGVDMGSGAWLVCRVEKAFGELRRKSHDNGRCIVVVEGFADGETPAAVVSCHATENPCIGINS